MGLADSMYRLGQMRRENEANKKLQEINEKLARAQANKETNKIDTVNDNMRLDAIEAINDKLDKIIKLLEKQAKK